MNASLPQPADSAASNPASAVRRDTPAPLPAGMSGPPGLIEQAMLNQPIARILRVLGEPSRGASQPETVSPLIHIAAHSLLADLRQRVREHQLQVAHGAFLGIVSARVRAAPSAAAYRAAQRSSRRSDPPRALPSTIPE